MNTPTPSSLLIDALQPKQRAILYSALMFYKSEMNELYTDHVANTEAPNTPNANKIFFKVAEAMRWADEETATIVNTLFAECFPEDLDVTQYAFKEVQARKERESVSGS
jgi:hypothetical protein